MAETLIIGYGNADRQDDGAGWHVIKNLAEKFDCKIPDDPGASIDITTDILDLLYILQIYPELAETISHYQRVCFVDAHTSEIPYEICWQKIVPEYEKSPLTHHMSPRTVLSITTTIYGVAPEAILVSIRGYHFKFDRNLSSETAQLVEKATDMIWEWITSSV
jgi:hydrogenase maturation protease